MRRRACLGPRPRRPRPVAPAPPAPRRRGARGRSPHGPPAGSIPLPLHTPASVGSSRVRATRAVRLDVRPPARAGTGPWRGRRSPVRGQAAPARGSGGGIGRRMRPPGPIGLHWGRGLRRAPNWHRAHCRTARRPPWPARRGGSRRTARSLPGGGDRAAAGFRGAGRRAARWRCRRRRGLAGYNVHRNVRPAAVAATWRRGAAFLAWLAAADSAPARGAGAGSPGGGLPPRRPPAPLPRRGAARLRLSTSSGTATAEPRRSPRRPRPYPRRTRRSPSLSQTGPQTS